MAEVTRRAGIEHASNRRAGLTTVAGQLTKAVIQLVGLVVLSKLLNPRDFGIFALITVIIALGDLLRDFGITQAALQATQLTRQQTANLFWTGVGIGAVLSTSTVLLSETLANLFGHPELSELAIWAAMVMLVNATQPMYQVALARTGRFTELAITDVVAQTFGLTVAITLAQLGTGHWALVAQVLTAAVILAGSRAVLTRWIPAMPRKTAGMGELYRYSLNLGAAQLLGYGASNVDTYSIGIRYSAYDLGLYNRAFQLITVPTNLLLSPLTNVVLPALSRARQVSAAAYQKTLHQAQLTITIPLCAVFSVVVVGSQEILTLALGEQWKSAHLILSILSVAGMFQALLFISFWGFLASGRTRQLLYYNIVMKSAQVCLILWGATQSMKAVSVCYCIAVAISWPVSIGWLSICDNLPSRGLLRDGLIVLGASGAAIGTCQMMLHAIEFPGPIVRLSAIVVVCISIYVAALAPMPQIRDFMRSVMTKQFST